MHRTTSNKEFICPTQATITHSSATMHRTTSKEFTWSPRETTLLVAIICQKMNITLILKVVLSNNKSTKIPHLIPHLILTFRYRHTTHLLPITVNPPPVQY